MSESLRLLGEVTESLSYYEEAMSEYNSNFPQRQGLFPDEFQSAVNNTLVNTTDLIHDGRKLRLPQLVPVEQYSWLNAEEYERRFPSETSENAVRHYTHIPGVQPGEDVKRGLLELAQKRGILVFDFPDTDSEYIERVVTTLKELEISTGSVDLLGTQTYFGGKVSLKHGYNPDIPVKSLHQAFSEMVELGIVKSSEILDGASYTQTIEREEAGRLFAIYEKAFEKLNHHPCRQGLSPEEFLRVLSDEPEIAKLRYNQNGETSTLMILGDDLSKYPWLNQEFYQKQYPDEYNKAQILYFPALYTDPERQGEVNSEYVVNLISQMVEFGNNEIIVAFDCCDINVGFLDKYIEELVNKTPQANLYFDNLGTQKYVSIPLSIK